MKQAELDIVYILGTGSKWENNELRYSLRSVEMYLPHRHVFIVGECPHFLRGIYHIPCGDKFGNDAVRNTTHKIHTAAQANAISDDFVLMNDDFYLLQPVEALEHVYRETMEESLLRFPDTTRNFYGRSSYVTYAILKEQGIKQPLAYTIHYPSVLNKKNVIDLVQRFPYEQKWKGKAYPLFKSLYYNIYNVGGTRREDNKCKDKAGIIRHARTNSFSCGNTFAKDQDFRNFVTTRYPNKSRYEK